jgi:hypothetical protein
MTQASISPDLQVLRTIYEVAKAENRREDAIAAWAALEAATPRRPVMGTTRKEAIRRLHRMVERQKR